MAVSEENDLSTDQDELKYTEQYLRGSRITAGLRVKGEISGREDLYINGSVEGPIDLRDGMLTLESRGDLVSEVKAREIVIFGRVQGKLTVRDRLKIMKDGSVEGDLVTGRILIEDGAHFKGSIEIIRDRANLNSAKNGTD